jgi:glycosyltransferase involved in cell wall biosynthesis
MRIAVDATPWFNERGYGRFAREILRALVALPGSREWIFLLDQRDVERIGRLPSSVRVRGVRLSARPTDAASASGSRSVRDLFAMRRAAGEERPDVLFYPTVYTYCPVPRGVRAVVTVHDAIAERFPELTLPSRRARFFWNLKVRHALARSRLVLTVSDFAAAEIEEVLRVDRARIRVSGEAPAAAFGPGADRERIAAAAARAGIPPGGRWFTYVGGFNPHKHVDVLVRAHARLAREVEDPPHLLLVGTRDRDAFHTSLPAIEAAVEAGGARNLVHWPGFVADEELALLHAGALACALPSACEGFGLPAVEAAACGAPVLATTRSPLPRLLEGGGLFVEPRDEEALFAALRTMATDEPARAAMAARAIAKARELSWERAARAALDAIEEAAR